MSLWADGDGASLLAGRAVQQRIDPRTLATPDLLAWWWVTLRDDLIHQFAGHPPDGGIGRFMSGLLTDIADRYPRLVAEQVARLGEVVDPDTWGVTPDAVAGLEAAMRMVDDLAGG